jgi:hypothetical protein
LPFAVVRDRGQILEQRLRLVSLRHPLLLSGWNPSRSYIGSLWGEN